MARLTGRQKRDEVIPEELVFCHCFMKTFNRAYAAYLAGYVPEIPRGREVHELSKEELSRLNRSANRIMNREIPKKKLNELISNYFEQNKILDLDQLLQNLSNIIIRSQTNEYKDPKEVKNNIEATKLLLMGHPKYGQDGESKEAIYMFRSSEDFIRFEKKVKRTEMGIKEG